VLCFINALLCKIICNKLLIDFFCCFAFLLQHVGLFSGLVFVWFMYFVFYVSYLGHCVQCLADVVWLIKTASIFRNLTAQCPGLLLANLTYVEKPDLY